MSAASPDEWTARGGIRFRARATQERRPGRAVVPGGPDDDLGSWSNADLLVTPLMTDAFGRLRLDAPLPPGLPACSVWLQVWITDVDGPVGFAASNGVRVDVPAS